jgi:MerR family transcriptional regulator, redox-sensitive transcriptional activator SoxR
MASMTIGEVAGRAGLNTSHVRYYERVGVLPKPPRIGNQRRYDEEVLHRLAIIDVAQRAGLTLDEIRDLTGPDNQGPRAGDRIRELAESKLPEVDALISRAQAVKAWLEHARTCDCRTVDVCSLFTDPAIAPPPAHAKLEVRPVGTAGI